MPNSIDTGLDMKMLIIKRLKALSVSNLNNNRIGLSIKIISDIAFVCNNKAWIKYIVNNGGKTLNNHISKESIMEV